MLLPATTALTRLAPPSLPGGHTFHFKQKSAPRRGRAEAQLTLAGYTHVSSGRVAGRIRGARRADRPVPDGLERALPRRPVRRRGRLDPHLRPRHPAQPLPGARSAPAARAASSRSTRPRARRSACAGASASRATRPRRGSTRTWATASPAAASSTTCRCSSTRPRRIFDYLPAVGHAGAARRRRRRAAALLDRHPRAPPLPAAPTPSGRSCRPRTLFLKAEQFFDATRACGTLSLRRGAPAATTAGALGAAPLPDVSVERGATAPLARLQQHIAATPLPRPARRRQRRPARDAAGHAARRTHRAAERRHAGRVRGQRREGRDHRGADQRGLLLVRAGSRRRRARSSSSPRTSCSPPAPTPRRRRRGQEQTSSVDALIKDLSELKLGDPVVHATHGIGRYMGLINIDLGEGPSEFLHLEYADKATLYVPVAQLAPDQPLHRRVAPRRRRCTSSARASGTRRAARPPSRCATPPPSCSTSTRAAPRATATRTASRRTTTRPSPTSFGFEETPDQRAAIHAVIQDLVSPQADGPPGLRRRRLRQDRGRAARRLRRGARRQAGRAARADHAAGRAALPDHRRAASASGR